MTLGAWIPQYLDAYKRGTIKDDSFYTLELVVRHIPQELKSMDMDAIRPMHLQKFYNAFAKTVSKSYMDKMRVLINNCDRQRPLREEPNEKSQDTSYQRKGARRFYLGGSSTDSCVCDEL